MAANEAARIVCGLDTGKYVARRVAEIERQRQEFVSAFDRLGLLDARDAQIDFHEVVDADRVVLHRRFGLVCFLRLFNHPLHLFGLDPLE